MNATIDSVYKTLILHSSATLKELNEFMEQHNILDYTITVGYSMYGIGSVSSGIYSVPHTATYDTSKTY